jgi:hypothetical protein
MSAGQGAALVIGGLIFIAAFVWMLARLDRAQRRRIERNRQARWAAGATGGAIAGGYIVGTCTGSGGGGTFDIGCGGGDGGGAGCSGGGYGGGGCGGGCGGG